MSGNALPLVEKYRPQTLDEVQGNNTDIDDIERWAQMWQPGDTPLLLHGPPGVGKTATVQALANDMGWDIEEVNASSARTTEDIKRLASSIVGTPVSDGKVLYFVDEVDSMYHSVSLTPLLEKLRDPPAPIILVGNKDWKIPNKIKRKCREFEFSLGKRSIKAKLKEIAEAEGIDISKKHIGKLATRGNLRAAIHDLQTYAETGELPWDQRRTEDGNFEVVENVLRGENYVGDMLPEKMVLWLNENLAEEFRGLERGVAYDSLARADKWLGRANRTQNYHWWAYAGALAEQTANLRLVEPYEGYIDISYPTYYRHSTPTIDDDSSEAKLYRKLKNYDKGPYSFSGDFVYFRKVILPLLTDLPKGVRYRLAIDAGLSHDDDAVEALGISASEYESWLGETHENEGQSLSEW